MKGFAFCEYVDPSVTDIAIQGLNGMELGEKRLKVWKVSVGIKQVSGIEMGVNAMSMLAGTTSTDNEESPVIQLLNMVTAEELMDNDDYEGKTLFTLSPNPKPVETSGPELTRGQKFARMSRTNASNLVRLSG